MQYVPESPLSSTLSSVPSADDILSLYQSLSVGFLPGARGPTRAEISYALAEINLEITGYFGNQVEMEIRNQRFLEPRMRRPTEVTGIQ